MKICRQCKKEKSYSEFGRSKWSDGYRAVCNECRRTTEAPKYYKKHQQTIQNYKQRNREKILKENKAYYKSHSTYFSSYRIKHSEQYRQWRINNRARLNAYRKQLKITNPDFKIACNLRSRMSTLLRRCKTPKSSSMLKLLGCSLEQLKEHLESQFLIGMSWDTYGSWHIDHIRPCASFDLSKPEQQATCFHYSNLQPLWASDNLKKNKKLNS